MAGQSYETLNYSVESSRPRSSYFEKPRSFRDEAKEEIENPEPEDYNHWFINVYSDSGYTFHTERR